MDGGGAKTTVLSRLFAPPQMSEIILVSSVITTKYNMKYVTKIIIKNINTFNWFSISNPK
jgi:hypothetical protein